MSYTTEGKKEFLATIVKIADAVRQALPQHPCQSVREARRSNCPTEVIVMIQSLGHYVHEAETSIASRDARIAGLEADLREERDRVARMSVEWDEEVGDLLEKVKHAEDVIAKAVENEAEKSALFDYIESAFAEWSKPEFFVKNDIK